MEKPDFRAFEEYLSIGWDRGRSAISVAKSQPDDASRFFILDLGRYENSDNKQTINRTLARHLSELADTKNALTVEFQRNPEFFVRKMIDASLKNSRMDGAGGVAIPDLSLAMSDSRGNNLGGRISHLFAQNARGITSRDEHHFEMAIRHHEAAHLILGLKEPGADFVSAALVLRDNPDARDALRMRADIRMISSMKYPGDRILYGAECHDAIEHALSIPREKLLSMSLRELYSIGTEYDRQNKINNTMGLSPETAVRERILPTQPDERSYLRKAWDYVVGNPSPQTTIDKVMSVRDIERGLPHAQFREGSVEDSITDNLRESLARLKQHVAGASPGR